MAQPDGAPGPAAAEAAAPSHEDLAPRPRRAALTGFEVAVLVSELQALVGGYLDKAYQPTREEVVLRFRAPALGRRDLYIQKGGIACLTENSPAMPTQPPGFAMAIRKHAAGGRVVAITQHGFDRIITIAVLRKEGEFRIVAELFGDGNIMLVRPDGRILLPLVQEAWAHRTIRGGVPYVPPPARDDPRTFDRAAFITACRRGNRDLVRALAIEAMLGGPTAEETLLRAGLDKKAPISAASDAELGRAFDTWRGLAAEAFAGVPDAYLLVESGRPIDWSAHRSLVLEAEAASDPAKQTVSVASLSAALDRLFLAGRRTEEHVARVEKVDEQRDKLGRQLAEQEKAVARFAVESVDRALDGELLFGHFQTVERIRTELLAARASLDWKGIQARIEEGRKADHPDARKVVRIEPTTGRLTLRLTDAAGAEREVTIDIAKSLTENAQAAYDRAKKAREKLAGARSALDETRTRMAAAAVQRESAEAAVDAAMERSQELVGSSRHHWFEGYRWFITTSGHLVVGGRDAASNDRLVKRHLEAGDRYVHSEIHGAPSVVVKRRAGEETPVEAMEEAAVLAVAWSRAFGRFAVADAYWVTPEQVSKTPQTGEYLARGAFIVRGERNWVRKVPAVASLGLVWLGKEGHPVPAPADPSEAVARPKIMGGPPEAVHLHAAAWVDIEAGDVPRTDVVRRLARAFSAHPDAIERTLPQGPLHIIRHHGLSFPEASG